MEFSECCTCGYTWLTGQSGSHSCERLLKLSNDLLKEELSTLVDTAEQFIKSPESKAALAVLRNAVDYHREVE